MFVYICGMSESQNKIYDHLTQVSRPLIQHLIKLKLYSDAREYAHWKKEIWSSLYDVDKLKGKNKWPPKKFIYDALSTHLDNLEAHINYVIDYEDELEPEYANISSILNFITDYFSWLSTELSSHGSVRSAEVYSKLNELLR